MKHTIVFFCFLFISSILLARDSNVILLPSKNIGLPEYNWFGFGIHSLTTSNLDRLERVNLVHYERYAKAFQLEVEFNQVSLQKMESLMRIDFVVSIQYSIKDNTAQIVLSAINGEKAKKETQITGTLDDDIGNLQNKIILGIMELSNQLKSQYNQPIQISEKELKKYKEFYSIFNKAGFELFSKGLESKKNEPLESSKYLENALKESPQNSEILKELGIRITNDPYQYSESLDYLLMAEDIFKKRNEDETRNYIYLLYDIGNAYIQIGDSNHSLSYYLKAKKLCDKKLLSGLFYANLLYKIGIIHKAKNDSDKAFHFHYQAKKIYETYSLDKSLDYVNTVSSLGVCYPPDSDISFQVRYNANEMYEKYGYTKTYGYAKNLNNIGNLNYMRGKKDDALKFYSASQTTYEKIGMTYSFAYATLLNDVALIYKEDNKLDKSLETYKSAEVLMKKLNRHETLNYIIVLRNMGEIYYTKDDLKNAKTFLEEAKTIANTIQVKEVITLAHIMNRLGDIYQIENKVEPAKDCYQEAYRIYKKNKKEKEASLAIQKLKRISESNLKK